MDTQPEIRYILEKMAVAKQEIELLQREYRHLENMLTIMTGKYIHDVSNGKIQ